MPENGQDVSGNLKSFYLIRYSYKQLIKIHFNLLLDLNYFHKIFFTKKVGAKDKTLYYEVGRKRLLKKKIERNKTHPHIQIQLARLKALPTLGPYAPIVHAFTDNDDVSIWVKIFFNKTQNKGQSVNQKFFFFC